jgi:hypothetical protein
MAIVTYRTLFELTDDGLQLFRKVMTAQASEQELDLENRRYCRPVESTGPLEVRDFQTAKELAAAVIGSLGKVQAHNVAGDIGLWAWLTFVLRDCLFPLKKGVRKGGEIHKWYPSDPGDYQKAQRHLVRMPVLLLSQLGDAADHLLCGRPSVHPEMREQLTSQQDMMSPNFQAAARKLYFNELTKGIKRGSASQDGPGVCRRLAQVRKQLDVTWDMTDMTPAGILSLLPPEFDRFVS